MPGFLVLDGMGIQIPVGGLVLTVGDDGVPVGEIKGHCAVMIARREDVDLTDTESGTQLQNLLNQQRAV